MRAPEAPIGWPSAQAPPLTLTRSCGSPCSFMAAIATTAKASLISNRSMSEGRQPVRSNRRCSAPTGAVAKRAGACAKVLWPTTRASGAAPRRSAVEARIITSAAAPSEIDEALAAVTVPFGPNAGFNVGILSGLALNGCSSRATTVSPFLPAIVNGAISQPNEPSSLARFARASDSIA